MRTYVRSNNTLFKQSQQAKKPNRMKLLIKAANLAVLFATTATLTHAAGDNCYQIQNSDAKYFCLATAKNDGNYCYQISKQDDKYMCLAVAKRDKNYCYQISKQDDKNMCLGKFWNELLTSWKSFMRLFDCCE